MALKGYCAPQKAGILPRNLMGSTRIEVLADRSAETPSDKGFLKVRRLELRTHFEDGTQTESYRYDVVDRAALDAVVMVLHAEREGHPRDPYVLVRTALRPPVGLRALRELPVPDPHPGPLLWELPAGLIEVKDKGPEGVLATAARETEEETGYVVTPGDFALLGVAVYLSPGMSGEKLHFAHARVDRSRRTAASSTEVVERGARSEWWTLSEAFARAAAGDLEDCKTELGLWRLRALLEAKA